jgi:hypothetical protein
MSVTNEGIRRSATGKPGGLTSGHHACIPNIRHLMVWPICAAAITLLSWPAPAQANTCNKWGFPGGRFLFHQSNGYTLELSNPSGDSAQSRALAWNDSGDRLYGTAGGNINGYRISFDVAWTSGSIGAYRGGVNLGGFASGTTYDLKNPDSTASWDADAPLRCIS